MKKLLLMNLPSEELLTDSDLQAKLRGMGIGFDAIQIDRPKSKVLVYVNDSEKIQGILGYTEDDVVVSDFLDPASGLFDEKYNMKHHGTMIGMGQKDAMQPFCHTAAYPKPIDVTTHHTLPDFIMTRGGVSLRPGDGIIHSCLNRMLLPDTVGTGGDSHTRFPIGISFPAGSGLVAFAAATGLMPLDMPESVLVRFKGTLNPGITLRDLVRTIPYGAIHKDLLNDENRDKSSAFSGRILEIEGLDDLTVEQAFELSDASAECSAAGCTIKLSKESITEYLQSNVTRLRWMIGEGYGDARTLERRAQAMEAWLANPQLIEADNDAEYAEIIEIDLADVKEPVLCAPNDPDDAR